MILKDGTIDNEKFGQELILDLYKCDAKKISSQKHIREFVIKLCDEIIFMRRYGEPLIPHFGLETPVTAGYSLVQLIETSCVSAHFSEYKKSVYLNIFSCKWFDADAAAEVAAYWFGSKEIRRHLLMRRD